MTEDLLSNRTYLMSPRAKSVVDNASIMLPGYSKTEVVNTAIFLLGSEIRARRRTDSGNTSIKAAFEEIREELNNIGYGEIISSVLPDRRSQTKLDKFLDKDGDDELAELIVDLINSSDESEAGGDHHE